MLPEGALTGAVEGDVEKDRKVLVLKRIRVHYTLRLSEEHRTLVERVHGFHAGFCPVARSVENSIDISTSFELVDPDS